MCPYIFSEFMHSYETKVTQNASNLIKQQFLIHADDVFYKISVAEY
jgi:hypothetical protein